MALGVGDAVRDDLAVEAGELLNEVHVVQNDGTGLAGGDGLVFAHDRLATAQGGVGAGGGGVLATVDYLIGGGLIRIRHEVPSV